MAQVKTVQLVDDLTGRPADETVEFGVDGKRYEIELSADNAKSLRDAMAAYVGAARRRPRLVQRRGGGQREPSAIDRRQTRAIREWARSRGMTVSDRGRLSEQVLTAYRARTD